MAKEFSEVLELLRGIVVFEVFHKIWHVQRFLKQYWNIGR